MVHPLLQIQLLGGFYIAYADKLISSLNTTRLQSLLAYLVLNAKASQPRQRVAFLLWPDTSESHARNNLRQLLHQLRSRLPDPDRFLAIDAHSISWLQDPDQMIDVQRFEYCLAEAGTAEQRGDMSAVQGDLEEALGYYRGDLIPNCYDEWIAPDRERLRQACHVACQKLVGIYEGQRDYTAALQAAQTMLRLDPLDENTYLALMRLYVLNNNRTAARRVYKEASETLQRELNVEPGEMLKRAYEQVQRLPTRGYLVRSSDTLALVGRQAEWRHLQSAWQRASSGNPHLVLITGEAGIGKSRLAEELFTWVSQQGFTAAQTRSYAAEGHISLAPVTDWLRSPALRPHLNKLDKVWLTEVARLLPELLSEDARLTSPGPISEYGQRRHFIEALARAILAAPHPALLWIDDLQWCDLETLEWLHFLLRFEPRSSLLVLGTARSEELPSDHPLVGLTLQLHAENRLSTFELQPLDAAETARLASQIQGKELDDLAATRLFHETEGNPLFIVETVRAGNRTTVYDGSIDIAAGLRPALSLPPRAHAVIAGRLSQLSLEARGIAELGSAIGQAFSLDVLLLAGPFDETVTIRALDELWQKRIVREQGPNIFDFTHDKLREVAYEEISAPKRRMLHRQIALALETLHAGNLAQISAQIAVQFEQAGMFAQALPYYQRAGDVAASVYANEDAIYLWTRALVLLSHLPADSTRNALELHMQLILSSLYSITKGWTSPEVEQCLDRALILSNNVGDLEQRAQTLFGLEVLYAVQARLEKVRDIHPEMLRLFELTQGSLPPNAELMFASTNFHMGNLIDARKQFESIVSVREEKYFHNLLASQGLNHVVHGQDYLSHILWCLGYPRSALDSAHAAIDFAREFGQPFDRAKAVVYMALLQEWCADPAIFRKTSEEGYALSDEYKAPYYLAWANILLSFARMEQRPNENDLARLHDSIRAFIDTGAHLRLPVYFSLLARAYHQAGQIDSGLNALEQAFDESQKNKEHWWDAELHRLRGELIWSQGANEDEAEAAYRRAIEISQSQQAKSLELRSATSLGRLWQATGRVEAAIELLAPIYAWFSEGLDTPDLRAAQALIAQLKKITPH